MITKLPSGKGYLIIVDRSGIATLAKHRERFFNGRRTVSTSIIVTKTENSY